MRKKWKTHKVCGRNRSARRINGFTQGVESQPLPLIHRAIGDSGSHGQREDRAGQFRFPAQAVKIAIAPTMGWCPAALPHGHSPRRTRGPQLLRPISSRRPLALITGSSLLGCFQRWNPPPANDTGPRFGLFGVRERRGDFLPNILCSSFSGEDVHRFPRPSQLRFVGHFSAAVKSQNRPVKR